MVEKCAAEEAARLSSASGSQRATTQAKLTSSRGGGFVPHSEVVVFGNEKRRALSRAFVEQLLKRMQPVTSNCRSKIFKAFVALFGTNWTVPNVQTAYSILDDFFVDLRDRLKQELKTVFGGYKGIPLAPLISADLDHWTCPHTNLSYCALNVHYLSCKDGAWNKVTRCLACSLFAAQHTAENIADWVLEEFGEYGIPGASMDTLADFRAYVLCNVSDNASNMVKSIVDILGFEKTSCAIHSLSRNLNAGFQEPLAAALMRKCKKHATDLHQSNVMTSDFMNVQEQLGITSPVTIPQAAATRWEGVVNILDVMHDRKLACENYYTNKDPRYEQRMDVHDWEKLTQILAFTEPFRRTFRALEYTTKITSNEVGLYTLERS